MQSLARKIPLIFSILGIILVMAPGAHADSVLFYDNFTPYQAGFPNQWSPQYNTDIGNVTSDGNFALLTVSRQSASGGSSCFANHSCFRAMSANNTQAPIVGPNTKDGQFVQMIWRLAPFNMTTPGTNNQVRAAELLFGLSTAFMVSQPLDFIYFAVQMADEPNLCFLNCTNQILFNQKSMVTIQIFQQITGVGACLSPLNSFVFNFGNCAIGTDRNPISYTSPQNQIDLTQLHTFYMQARFFQVSHTSWVAFRVDDNAWLNVTQAACSCIDGSGGIGSYNSLYPAVQFGYEVVNGLAAPSQSVRAAVNYVLVTDYLTSAPAGQGLPPATGVVPPTKGPSGPSQAPFCSWGGFCPGTPGNSGTSVPSYLLFTANQIGQGNLFFGGYMLTMLFDIMFCTALALAGVRSSWIFVLATLPISVIMFSIELIGLWTVIIQFLIAAGLLVGVYRGRISND